MAFGESVGSRILLCLGLFLGTSSFCHCTPLTRLKALDKLRENLTISQSQPSGSGLHHGRLFIGQITLQNAKIKGTVAKKNLLHADTDYQADMAWPEPKQPKEQADGSSRPRPIDSAVERLLKMEPKVECTEDSMKLQVQDATSTPGGLFFVDRGSRLSPLPLSKLPPSCGYTIRSTRKDLVLVAPYDGCFVTHEEDSYVLPLHWCGVPVRMSCPLTRPSSPKPPMVTCHAQGMVVKTEWTVSVAKIKVNLNGNWEPLMKASPRCGFSVVAHPEGVVISVHYALCLEKKDGMYTLALAGDGETKISCPSLSAVQPEPTKSPAKGPKQQTEMPNTGVHPTTPSHNSGSARYQTQSPQSALPQVPGFPQNPELPNKKPNQGPKDVNQPQLPYYPFYPNFFYQYPDTKPTPTAQPLPSPLTKENGLQSKQTVSHPNQPMSPEGQVPQPLIPLPFYPWPAQPENVPVQEEPSVQPPATQPPNGKAVNPFYPYPHYVKPPNPDVPPAHRPELEPIPTVSFPVIQTTKSQRRQPYYPFPFYPQPPRPETSPTHPPVTKPLPGKLDEHVLPNPFNPSSGHPQKPVGPPASQPEGQEHTPFIPFPFYPQPPASEDPQVERPLHPLYPETPEKPLPEKTVPPVSQEPQGQIYQPFYPYPFYPPFWPPDPYQVHVPFKQQIPTLAPKGQVQQPLSPLPPEVFKPKVPGNVSPSIPHPTPESKEPSQPEAPQGQVHKYPYPQPDEKPTTVQPPQPEAPWGQVNQLLYPYLFYPQPEAKNQPAEKPANKPSYPQSSGTPGAGTPTEKPVPSVLPPGVKPLSGQMYYPFNPYYPLQPQHPQPITLPPAISMQQPQQVTIMQPSNGGIVPQGPQSSSPYMPPLYCPQFCPSGLSNCCPQIAFHQYLHIVPADRDRKDTPVYPVLPSLPSVAYSGFGNGLATAPLPQKPTEAMTMNTSKTSPSVLTSLQSLPPGNEKQPYLLPPDGNPAVLTNIPRKPTNPDLPIYPYFVPHSLYPNWPYPPQNEKLQNLLQSQSATHYNVPPKLHTPGNDQLNPMVRYEPYYIKPPEQQMSQLSPEDMNNPSGPNFRSYIGKEEHKAKELQPSNKPTESKGQTHSKIQSELDRFLVPYMLQDAEAPTYNSSSQPQPFVSVSMKSTKHKQTVHPYSEPNSYVLLQHGPPGREPNSFSESPLPFRDLVRDTNFLAQNLVRQHSSKPQHPQNLKPQHTKGLGKMFSLLPGSDNYMPKSEDASESLPLFASTSDGPHFGPFPQNPSFSAAHLRPEFPESLKDMWKPSRPLGSDQTIPAHGPGKTFQRWSNVADHQANGLNQAIQSEGGNQKQK
ncbi:proline-rich extensin-like protein EPR1 isoform X3 [Xiphias gladius]|uniref:proline-rich extensin-like protein EPR1 isoform X2 n=1 Tax=Xiphias gladius TaxID=8245 RepID=UPI001A991902|nr:proline-rich extensin-like protein EPR1 isoform X2 [Xiphias gladius]XP_040000445.1 proline-rich extensin-like protein EPR1 isoform X3 [Xiphias gladius]